MTATPEMIEAAKTAVTLVRRHVAGDDGSLDVPEDMAVDVARALVTITSQVISLNARLLRKDPLVLVDDVLGRALLTGVLDDTDD